MIFKYFKISCLFCFVFISFKSDKNILEKDLIIEDEVLEFASSPLKVNVNTKGEVFITNTDLNAIYLFSVNGEMEKKISREGRGPGEFIGLGDTFLDDNDQLYVLDSKMGKITTFSPPDYEVATEVKIPLRIDNQRPESLYKTEKGDYLVAYSEIISLRNPNQGKNILYTIDLSGNFLKDTTLSYSDDQVFVYTSKDQIATFQVPFGYKSLLKRGPDGKVYWGKTDKNFIQVFNGDGSRYGKVDVKYNPVPVPDDSLQELRNYANSDKPGSVFFKDLFSADVIPEFIPVFDWFVVDDKSRIWVAVNTEDRQNYSLRVYGQDRNSLGDTSLSKSVELKTIRDRYAYGIQKEENGTQSVVRYKIKNL